MAKLTLQQYMHHVRRSGLVPEGKLQQIAKQLEQAAANRPLGPEHLAQRLLDADLITTWQNDKLMQGKHQGFMLGKYKLLRHLSSGGMSSVYLGEHTLMQRKVAIKVLPPARIDDSSYLPRFKRECKAMASLDHPNIVRAHDFDVDGKLHYLVLEFVDGQDLQAVVEKEGPLAFARTAEYIAQAADGLAHAHSLNMVHRDMKPANLMVDRRGVVKVLDLGVARITGADEAESLTLAHNEDVLGTADFLAPEQALNSHEVDTRADVYSLGCTMYYLLTGGVPFKESNLAKKLMAHQTQQPPPVTEGRPDCPSGLVAILERMMTKDRDRRYQTMEEVARVLRAWVREYSGVAPETPSAAHLPGGYLPGVAPAGVVSTGVASPTAPLPGGPASSAHLDPYTGQRAGPGSAPSGASPLPSESQSAHKPTETAILLASLRAAHQAVGQAQQTTSQTPPAPAEPTNHQSGDNRWPPEDQQLALAQQPPYGYSQTPWAAPPPSAGYPPESSSAGASHRNWQGLAPPDSGSLGGTFSSAGELGSADAAEQADFAEQADGMGIGTEFVPSPVPEDDSLDDSFDDSFDESSYDEDPYPDEAESDSDEESGGLNLVTLFLMLLILPTALVVVLYLTGELAMVVDFLSGNR